MPNTAQELALRITGDSTGGQQSVAQLRSALRDARQDVKDLTKAMEDNHLQGNEQFQKELETAQQKVAGLEVALKSARPAVKGIGDDFEGSAPKVDDANKKLETLASTLTNAATPLKAVGGLMTAAFTAPLVGAAIAGEHFAADFQTQMTRVQTLAGASGAEVASMRKEVLDLGPAVGVGPAELAKGLFVLESAGQRGQQALDTLTVAGKMTAIGMGETEAMARGLVGVMLSYQQQNLSAAQAGDILTKTVQRGNMKIDELVPALARVNPLAAAMGIKFQDVAAAIATFTHMGAPAEVAATGLRAVLSNILNDSAKTEKGFALLSQTLGDSSISMTNFRKEIAEKGLAQALIDLMEKANAAGEKGMESLNKIFPNIKALTEVLANAKANGAMYLSVTRAMYDSNGTLNDSFAETQKTFDQHWKELKASADVMLITLGDSLLPTFQRVVDVVRDDFVPVLKHLADGFQAQPEPIKETIIVLGGLTAAMGPVIYVAGSLVGAAGSLVAAFVKVPAAIAVVSTAVASMEGTLAGAALTMLGPAGLIAAVGGLSYGLTRLADTVSGGKLSSWLTPFLSGTEDLKLKTQEAGATADSMALAFQRTGIHAKTAAEALQLNTRWTEDQTAKAKAAADANNTHAGAVNDNAKAHATLADKVKALTAEQRADIESKHALGESVKAIADETGIANDVISTFLKQQSLGAASTKAWKSALEEYNSVGLNVRDTIDQMDGATVEGIKYDLARSISQKTLKEMYGVTKEQIDAIVASLKEEKAWAQEVSREHEETVKLAMQHEKDWRDERTKRTAFLDKTLADEFLLEREYDRKLADLTATATERLTEAWAAALTKLGPPMQGFEAQWRRTVDAIDAYFAAKLSTETMAAAVKAAADSGHGFEQAFLKQLENFPNLLSQALTGGGGVAGAAKAIGAGLGSALGEEIGTGPIGQKLADGFAALFDRGGKASGAIAHGVSAALQLAVSAAGSGSFGDVVSYTVAGASIGFMIGQGIGAAIGAGVGAIVGIIKSIGADEKQVNAIRESFVIASGGIDQLAKAAQRAGVDMHAFLNAKEPADYERALKNLTDAITFQDSAMNTLDQVVQKYGFTIDELGPAMQRQNLDKQAQQLWQDWQLLNAAGVDTVAITTRMAQSTNDYFHLAMKTHTEIPQAMQPMLQAMIDAGQLTDANGNKITNLKDAGVTFSETMTEGFNKVVSVVQKLIDAIDRGLGLAIKNIPNPTVTGHVTWTVDGLPAPRKSDGSGDGSSDGGDDQTGSHAARGGWVTSRGVDPEYMSRGGFPGYPKGIDKIPVWAAEGEAFLNRTGAAELGPARLRALNAGMRIPDLAFANSTAFALEQHIHVHMPNAIIRSRADIQDLAREFARALHDDARAAAPIGLR